MFISLPPRHVLKEATIAAIITAVLAIPMIGLYTVSTIGGLIIHTRWVAVALAVVLAFVGRLGLVWWHENRAPRDIKTDAAVSSDWHHHFRKNQGSLLSAGLIFLFIFPLLPFADRYWVDLATTVLIYVMLAWGLNIVVGLAGLLDLGYVAFYAVGAYSFALMAQHFDLSFWFCLPLAGLFAALFGVLLGFPVLRLRGDYLAIVTLGFGEIIRVILVNWTELTNGPDGISGVPRPELFGLPFTRRPEEGVTAFHQFFDISYSGIHRVIFLYYLILLLALVTNWFVLRIRNLPIGRAWEALREDEIACRSLGINPTNTKLSAFALGAMFAGFAGAFFATRQGFISPESFTFIESAIILAIVVLGGMGSQIGVVIAAIILIGLPELARQLADLGPAIGQLRMLLFGAAMVTIMVWRPRGLFTRREPGARLHVTRQES